MRSSVIDRLIEKRHLPSLSLIVGRCKNTLAKEAERLALSFARAEDSSIQSPEGALSTHPIDKIRQFREQAYMPPLFGAVRIQILHEADRLPPASANMLLKLIEEPLSFSRFIFTAQAKERVLPTIVSRSQLIWIPSQHEPLPMHRGLAAFFAAAPYPNYLDFSMAIKGIVADMEKKKESEDGWQEEMASLLEEILRRHPEATPLIRQAKLQSERSFSISTIFESIFLRLGYVL